MQEANLLLGGMHVHIHVAAWQPHLLQWQRAMREMHDTVQAHDAFQWPACGGASWCTDCTKANSNQVMHVGKAL